MDCIVLATSASVGLEYRVGFIKDFRDLVCVELGINHFVARAQFKQQAIFFGEGAKEAAQNLAKVLAAEHPENPTVKYLEFTTVRFPLSALRTQVSA